MSDLLKRIEHDALRLSQQERAFLADRLLRACHNFNVTFHSVFGQMV
jgi:hypothetical protein